MDDYSTPSQKGLQKTALFTDRERQCAHPWENGNTLLLTLGEVVYYSLTADDAAAFKTQSFDGLVISILGLCIIY